LALSVPLSRSMLRVGGGSAFYVRPHYVFDSMANPETLDDWLTVMRGADEATIAVHRARIAGGSLNAKAAEMVYQEREAEKSKIKQEREADHNLWTYWCLADWGERFGMISFLFGVFCVGCGAAQIPWLARLISEIRSL